MASPMHSRKPSDPELDDSLHEVLGLDGGLTSPPAPAPLASESKGAEISSWAALARAWRTVFG